MAEVVAELPSGRRDTRTVDQRYPWDQWLDGQVWKLTRGVDFTIKPSSFRVAVKQMQKIANIAVSVRVVDDDVYIQAQIGTEPGKPRGGRKRAVKSS